jgi:ribA/ribD-fused uncharacterized protein
LDDTAKITSLNERVKQLEAIKKELEKKVVDVNKVAESLAFEKAQVQLKVDSLKEDVEKYGRTIQELRENNYKRCEELGKAHDEIIDLKVHLSADPMAGEYHRVTYAQKAAPKNKDYERGSKQSSDTIYFQGPTHPLSNFYECPWECQYNIYTHTFNTTEAAYQYQKAIFHDDFDAAGAIVKELTGRGAKEKSKSIVKDPTKEDGHGKKWHGINVQVMEDILREKVKCCPHYRSTLLKSGSKALVENVKNSTFWGCGPDGKGTNKLGKLHEKIRSALVQDGEDGEVQIIPNTNEKYTPKSPKSTEKARHYNSGRPSSPKPEALKPKVLLMGNSHVAQVVPKGVSPHTLTEKIITYTIREAHQALDQIENMDQYSAVILHLITNDIKTMHKNECIAEITGLVNRIKGSNAKPKVFLSVGLGRGDSEELDIDNEAIAKYLADIYDQDAQVHTIIHNSIPHPLDAGGHIFFQSDKVHLTVKGTSALVSNIRKALEKTLNITRDTQRKNRYWQQTPMNDHYGARGGGRYGDEERQGIREQRITQEGYGTQISQGNHGHHGSRFVQEHSRHRMQYHDTKDRRSYFTEQY